MHPGDAELIARARALRDATIALDVARSRLRDAVGRYHAAENAYETAATVDYDHGERDHA